MSTRCCVAYKDSQRKKWTGVFSHWDGYPSGVGKTIWDILHRDFIDNEGVLGVQNNGNRANAIQAFIDIYIKGHKGGWSSFGKECYCHSPAFVMRDGVSDNTMSAQKDMGMIEYVYVINPKTKTMEILSPIKRLAVVNLLGKEPNWGKLEGQEI